MLTALRSGWRTGSLVCVAILLQMSFCVAHAETDPPSRVARLNYLEGTVTFSPAGTDDWSVATLNRPLTIGDRIWADKDSRTELHVGSTAMRLGAATSMEVLDLDDQSTQLKLTQGTFSIRVRALDHDDNVEIDTPNFAFVAREPGEYRFDIDPDRDTTTLTVRRGSGDVYGSNADNRSVRVTSKRQLTFSGGDLFYSYSGDAPPRDTFDRWAAQRDEREDGSRSVRYVSRDMTGYEELDDNGDWREVPDYGPVWVPRVTIREWAPYHYGHWAWIAPWGWTWVDDERWGFAPFHYGRWAHIDNYWGWVPGPIERRPVYAPALVAFVGSGDGGHWGVSLSVGTPGVAWFALAPGERYRPAYTSNTTYLNNINRTVIVNRTVVRENVYLNQRVPNAIAAMPANAFVHGEAAHEHMHEVREDRLREFSKMPSASSLPVAPVAPVRQSVVSGAQPAQAAPPARFQDHAVVGHHQAPEAPALHDGLARRFSTQQGTVPGAGPVFTPTARPVRSATPIQPAAQAVPDLRRSEERTRPAMENAPRSPMPPQRDQPINAPREGVRSVSPDVAQPPAVERHERVRDERQHMERPADQTPITRPVPQSPTQPPTPPREVRPAEERRIEQQAPRPPIEQRDRGEDRFRQDSPRTARPAEQAPVVRPMPQAPAPAPREERPAQERRTEQAPPQPHVERPRREERPTENAPAPQDSKVQKPQSERNPRRDDDRQQR